MSVAGIDKSFVSQSIQSLLPDSFSLASAFSHMVSPIHLVHVAEALREEIRDWRTIRRLTREYHATTPHLAEDKANYAEISFRARVKLMNARKQVDGLLSQIPFWNCEVCLKQLTTSMTHSQDERH